MLGTITVACCLTSALLAQPARAQPVVVDREAEIKAAYLYNFGKYVEWPAETDAAVGDSSIFVIGVVGEHAVTAPLREVAQQKELNGRKIVVRQIHKPEDYRPCHLVFFSAEAPPTLREPVLAAARKWPTLTVGERPGFAHTEGIINLYLEQNRVKFEINAQAARRSRIQISSKLLSIGTIVTP